jgi:beta-galactosidase
LLSLTHHRYSFIVFTLFVPFLIHQDIFGRVAWLGSGPHECYPDRKASAIHAVHSASIETLDVPYIRPGENGARCDTHQLDLMSPRPTTDRSMLISITNESSKRGFSFSTSTFSVAELSMCSHYSTMQRQCAKSVGDGLFYLHLDPFMMGVGGDDR